MSRLVPVSLVALFATFAATADAVAGATLIAVPEPSSMALLASGVEICVRRSETASQKIVGAEFNRSRRQLRSF